VKNEKKKEEKTPNKNAAGKNPCGMFRRRDRIVAEFSRVATELPLKINSHVADREDDDVSVV